LITDAKGGTMARGKTKDNTTRANLGFESKLWNMADSLRGSMDSAEYKHVVLGLVFLSSAIFIV